MIKFAILYALFLWVGLLVYAPGFTISITIIFLAFAVGNSKPTKIYFD